VARSGSRTITTEERDWAAWAITMTDADWPAIFKIQQLIYRYFEEVHPPCRRSDLPRTGAVTGEVVAKRASLLNPPEIEPLDETTISDHGE
jgi:hypothetical protein